MAWHQNTPSPHKQCVSRFFINPKSLCSSGKRTGELTRSLTGKKIKSAVFHTVGSGVVVTVMSLTMGNLIKSDLFE